MNLWIVNNWPLKKAWLIIDNKLPMVEIVKAKGYLDKLYQPKFHYFCTYFRGKT